MPQALYTQPITQSPYAIWSFLADLRNDRIWRLEIESSELESGEPRQAGARYREVLQWKGVRTEVVLQLVESVPGCRLVIETDDPGFHSRSTWTFEPMDGGALVTLLFSLETSGSLSVTEPVVWQIVSHWLERDLPLLEGHLMYATPA